jgi:hypothetical protein
MTFSPTPSERLAIRTANAALLDSPDASCDIVATIVFALGAAGLLRDDKPAEPQPLTARELQRAAHFTEAARLLEGRYDQDAVNFLDTMAGGIAAMANEVAAIAAPSPEDPHDSPLHREYRTCRDLPAPRTGAAS